MILTSVGGDEALNGWVDGRTDERTDGWMGGWTDGWMIAAREHARGIASLRIFIPRGIKSSDFMEAIAMSLASSLELCQARN